MTENDPNNEGAWQNILKVLEGGVPQLLLGPAGRAISRLIGGAVDVPAAKLRQWSQSIEDVTDARTTVMRTLASKAAELGSSDLQLVSRGLDNLLATTFREQMNKESVAAKTLEYLDEEPPAPDSVGPSDDWMNVFETHAARATSEELRDTFARVLAGKLRQPTSFSLATLQVVSLLDSVVAGALKSVLGHSLDGRFLLAPQKLKGQLYDDFVMARSLGILSAWQADTTYFKQFSSSGGAVCVVGASINDPNVGKSLIVRGPARMRRCRLRFVRCREWAESCWI